MDFAEILATGIVSVAAAIAGALAGERISSRVRKDQHAYESQLHALEETELRLKRFTGKLTAYFALPNPISAYQIVDALRDLAYLNPAGLDDGAINEVLAVATEGVFQRSWRDTITRSVVGDSRKDKALVERLVSAEMKLAARLRSRREELEHGSRGKPKRAPSTEAERQESGRS